VIELKHTGLKVSRLGLGTWQFSSKLWGKNLTTTQVSLLLSTAISQGINLIDTAEIYGNGRSERLLGEAILRLDARENFVVVTKIAGFRKPVFEEFLKAFKNSHKRLGSKPDIVLHHWPPRSMNEICKVVNALESLVAQGYVAAYGLSNYGLKELREALNCVRKIEPVANQLQYSLAYRVVEKDLLEYMKRNNIALLAWSPLAKGALAGLTEPKNLAQRMDGVFKTASKDEKLQNALNHVAVRHGVSKSTVALAWLISRGAIPVVGTTNPARIVEYAKALSISLDSQDIELLDKSSEKYVEHWGLTYRQPAPLASMPRSLQMLLVTLMRGI
jgi:aryl-alcohol dehydrogenase-like predicted oxidoreductase